MSTTYSSLLLSNSMNQEHRIANKGTTVIILCFTNEGSLLISYPKGSFFLS